VNFPNTFLHKYSVRESQPLPTETRVTDDAQRDAYRCPQGQPLPRRQTKHTEAAVLNRADPVICNTGPVKAACTGSDHGRAEPEALPDRERVGPAS
jgi:hypothetical protein